MIKNKIYMVRAGYYHNYTGIGKHNEENYTTNKVCDLLNQKDKRINELESFINKIADDNGDIVLINGYGYNIKTVIKND